MICNQKKIPSTFPELKSYSHSKIRNVCSGLPFFNSLVYMYWQVIIIIFKVVNINIYSQIIFICRYIKHNTY